MFFKSSQEERIHKERDRVREKEIKKEIENDRNNQKEEEMQERERVGIDRERAKLKKVCEFV